MLFVVCSAYSWNYRRSTHDALPVTDKILEYGLHKGFHRNSFITFYFLVGTRLLAT